MHGALGRGGREVLKKQKNEHKEEKFTRISQITSLIAWAASGKAQ